MYTALTRYLKQFDQLSDDDINLIIADFQKTVLKPGEKLTLAGTVVNQLFFIDKGILKITLPREEERDLAYYFLTSNRFTTFLYSVYGNVPAQQGLEAACDCEILSLDKEKLYFLFEKIPHFRTLLDNISHTAMVEMINTKNTYLAHDALKSYQLFLKNEPQVALTVPLVDIASYLGITPQSLSRVRRQSM